MEISKKIRFLVLGFLLVAFPVVSFAETSAPVSNSPKEWKIIPKSRHYLLAREFLDACRDKSRKTSDLERSTKEATTALTDAYENGVLQVSSIDDMVPRAPKVIRAAKALEQANHVMETKGNELASFSTEAHGTYEMLMDAYFHRNREKYGRVDWFIISMTCTKGQKKYWQEASRADIVNDLKRVGLEEGQDYTLSLTPDCN